MNYWTYSRTFALYSRIEKETYSSLSSREIIIRSPKELCPLRIEVEIKTPSLSRHFLLLLRDFYNDNNNYSFEQHFQLFCNNY